jgi:hypothetical protein
MLGCWNKIIAGREMLPAPLLKLINFVSNYEVTPFVASSGTLCSALPFGTL